MTRSHPKAENFCKYAATQNLLPVEPKPVQAFPRKDIYDLFGELPWRTTDEWSEADLSEVILYLRTSQWLKLPKQLKCLIPKYTYP